MAVLESTEFPFQYTETATGAIENITLITEFDTDLKKTFVYKKNFFGGRALIATQIPGENIIPFQNSEGGFNASNALRSQLVNNSNLKESINNSVQQSARQFLSLDGAFDPSSVSQQEVDNLLGTNDADTQATPDAPAPPGGSGGAGGNNPAAAGSPSTEPVPIPTFESREGTNNPNQLSSSTGGALRYPLEPGDNEDYIMFETYEYKPKTLSGALNSPVAQALGSSLGMVVLPIQSQISDNNTVGWADGRLNAVELAAFNLARTAIGSGFDAAVTKAGEGLNQFLTGSAAGAYKTAFQTVAAAQAAQVNDVFARTTGGILNPNLELLFQGPELRSFSFQFQLSARSQKEATVIREIIKFFKVSMSVQRSNTDVFLKSPNVFKIGYFKNGSEHKSLNKFKTCALRSFNVDYTPLGNYMTFDDDAGTMVSYGLSMQFQEIDPIYNDDYAKLGDEIGF